MITVIGPAIEPILVADMKIHLRVQHTAEDALIGSLIGAARAHVEGVLGRSLALQALELTLEAFPEREIKLPRPPIASVASVRFRDFNGALQPLGPESYALFPHDIAPLLLPAFGVVWPATFAALDAVKIAFTSGYADVPEDILAAMKMLVGHLYRNREAVSENGLKEVPMGVNFLLDKYRTTGWI
jgi:uncharacterized phiE125 gp8 family phage protein